MLSSKIDKATPMSKKFERKMTVVKQKIGVKIFNGRFEGLRVVFGKISQNKKWITQKVFIVKVVSDF